MRVKWTLVGGAGVAGALLATVILAHSKPVSGDSSSAGTTPVGSSVTATSANDPLMPYPLGPHPIEYSELSTAEQLAADAVHEAIDTSQPPSSFQAWSAATAAVGERADLEITARHLGLEGTAEDGLAQ